MQNNSPDNASMTTQQPLTKRKKRNNVMIGLMLIGVVVLLFAVTIVKLTQAWA